MKTGLPMRIISIVGLIAFSGCGPVLSVSGIANAQQSIELARLHQAEQQAPYEYHLAVEYWKKAKEEQGYSQYETSVKFANQAELFAKKSAKTSEGKSS